MNILILGDSITFGHGCSDRTFYWDYENNCYIGNQDSFRNGPSEYCWGSLIARELGHSVVNLSKSGTSNPNIAWTCLNAVKAQKFDLIISAFSYDDRMEVRHPDYSDTISLSPLSPPNLHKFKYKNWDKALELYQEELYHQDTGVYATHMAIATVVNCAEAQAAKCHWSAPEMNTTANSNLINDSLRSRQIPSMIQHFDLWNPNFGMRTSKDTPYCAADGHPSELAHYEYFQKIIKPLI